MPYTAARMATQERDAGRYQRHRPEQTLLYRIIDECYPAFTAHLAEQGRELPGYVQCRFEDYLKCGRLEYGFLRVRCESCHAEHLIAFSCKRRGGCPICGARRMAESAALLVEEVLPEQLMRQWVLSFLYPLRFLFASRPEIMGRVLGIVYRAIATHLVKKVGHSHKTVRTGAVILILRFGSALNLNIDFHMLFLDGVYVDGNVSHCRTAHAASHGYYTGAALCGDYTAALGAVQFSPYVGVDYMNARYGATREQDMQLLALYYGKTHQQLSHYQAGVRLVGA